MAKVRLSWQRLTSSRRQLASVGSVTYQISSTMPGSWEASVQEGPNQLTILARNLDHQAAAKAACYAHATDPVRLLARADAKGRVVALRIALRAAEAELNEAVKAGHALGLTPHELGY